MPCRCRRLIVGIAVLAAQAGSTSAQTVSQRGFVEGRASFFAQHASNDSTRVVGDFLARDEIFLEPAPWIRLAGGVDFRGNTHDQVEDDWRLDFSDRRARRPRLSIRRLMATLTTRAFTVDVGKQFIRWGQADIINPTDRFAPRDFLNVIDNELLAVAGARGVLQSRDETLEVVWVPRFTPSRTPLLNQRWTVVPRETAAIPIVDSTVALPRGSQAGVRWSHVGAGFESSLSFYNGFNNLPTVDIALRLTPFAIEIRRVYPAIRTYGADGALPTRWFTVKGETAYFTSRSQGASDTDEYVLFVVQLERQSGEWVFVGGYAGETVTRRRAALTFAPDRGLTRALLGRASYTIDPNRSVALDAAVRQNGDGAYAKAEYSQARGQHWRTTVTGVLIRGKADDFLGQYRRNSHVGVALRYSF